MNLNRVQIAGNLTSDPEMRYLTNGTAIVKFGVAANRKWRSETGEQKEEAAFIDVTAFGKTAEAIGQYFKKGRKIYLEGRLKLDQWEDKQTKQKRSKLGVVMESFQFVDSKQSENDAPPVPAREKPDKSDFPPDDSDGQIPF